jgi:NAD(P)H-binding
MKLVVGATGQLGGLIACQLLPHDPEVRVLVRPNSPYQRLVDAGALPVFADLKGRASLDAAVQGVDVVITTANAVASTGPDTIESVDLMGNRDLIDPARAAGVGQFIFTSALGSSPDSPCRSCVPRALPRSTCVPVACRSQSLLQTSSWDSGSGPCAQRRGVHPGSSPSLRSGDGVVAIVNGVPCQTRR